MISIANFESTINVIGKIKLLQIWKVPKLGRYTSFKRIVAEIKMQQLGEISNLRGYISFKLIDAEIKMLHYKILMTLALERVYLPLLHYNI